MCSQKSWFLMAGDADKIDMDDNTDMRFPIELPKKFISEFTVEGDTVLDPFAGFGTTLFAAQELGRIGIGVEYEQKRADWIADHLTPPSRIIHGDSRKLNELDIPAFDLCFTSPPYMRSFDEENPLTNYQETGDYGMYLTQMRKIFEQVRQLMKPEAHVLIEVENTFEKGKPMTPLAWDIAKELSQIFFLERELICCHTAGELQSPNVDHSYVFIFRKNR